MDEDAFQRLLASIKLPAPERELQMDYNENLKHLQSGSVVASVLLGLGMGQIAVNGMRSKGPHDAIDQKQSVEWAKKYLKTNKVDIAPEDGLNNAYYHKTDGKHTIRYDPTLSKSVMAHEIGHGMKKTPRVPFANIVAPALLGIGGLQAGAHLGNGDDDYWPGLGKMLLGGAILTPTLMDEYGASSGARKILADNNLKPRGLTRAWSTYALPLATGAGTLGAAYYMGKHYKDKLHDLNPQGSFDLSGL